MSTPNGTGDGGARPRIRRAYSDDVDDRSAAPAHSEQPPHPQTHSVPPPPSAPPGAGSPYGGWQSPPAGADAPQSNRTFPTAPAGSGGAGSPYGGPQTGAHPAVTAPAYAHSYDYGRQPGSTAAEGYAHPPQTEAEQPRRRGRGLGVAAVALAAIAAIAFGSFFALRAFSGGDPTPGPTEAAPTGGPSETTATPTTDPSEELQKAADDGTEQALAELDEHWVVQLSAKREGLEAEGKTWSDADMLAELAENERRYGDVILIRSSEFSTFDDDSYLVTVLAEPYDTSDEALEKCRDFGLDRDHCLAKKLSQTDGPEGATKLN